MTKNFKKIIQICLVAVFALAVTFSASLFVNSQSAKATDTTVTFNAASLGDAKHDTYGTSIRFDTVGQTWATYHNWVSASDWSTISDYTTINGRTVTEINNANPGVQPITLMMQPAGSFSFLRLYIPDEIMSLGDVKSMGILDGWSFNNGVANFKSSAVTFLRNGDKMVLSSAYSAQPTKASADITISNAEIKHRVFDGRGADSYVVSIDLGVGFGEYDLMYDSYKAIRNAIYINGKSIEEWNAQAIASDAKFADPSTYTYFPQNSTDPGHSMFRKPVGVWGTSTGFKLTLFQELFADSETITVTIGAGCYASGAFMVTETVSKQVFAQTVVDIASQITFLNNTHNANWNNTTSMYYINTDGVTYWTKAPVGGCLNEGDASDAGGGQIQMKYVYFNGTSLYDINKNDNGAYGSEQGNIAGGGMYAPILVTMSSELGSSLKLHVPNNFTNGKASHEEIVIKKGFSVYENGVSYYVSNDVVFKNNGSGWVKSVNAVEIETEVTAVITKANRNDGGNNENFVIFELSNNDYAGLNTTAIADVSSLFGYIDIDGNVVNSKPNEPFFNVWGMPNSVAFRAPGLDANGLQQVEYITIKAGAKFPSFITQNGGSLTYYVTTEDVTFVHSIPNDTWTVGSVSTNPKSYTVTFTVDGNTHHTATVEEGSAVVAPTAPVKDGYNFKQWTLNGTAYDFSTPVTSDITLVAEFEAIPANMCTVTFMVDDQVYTRIQVESGSKLTGKMPENPTKSADLDNSYTFKNWLKENGTGFTPTFTTITSDITLYASFTPKAHTEVTDEIRLAHQEKQFDGTETYLIKTTNNYWSKNAIQGGCLNEYDPANAGGGQEQMKYIYFNGTSLYDINKNDNGSYESKQGNIASGGIYAPILVVVGSDNGAYSFIQLNVPTKYGGEGETANENHKSIEIKAGLMFTENGVTYVVKEDIKWLNLNGSWVNAESLIEASDITFSNIRIDGDANELYKVDITSDKFNITCNNYDYMYGGNFAEYRKFIFINGVSVYDINENTDDSAYVYSTFPMTGADDATFAKPVLIETYTSNGASPTNKITIWIHKDYIASLEGDVVVTLGAGYNAYTTGNKALAENVNYTITANVEVDNGTEVLTHRVIKGTTIEYFGRPSKSMTSTAIYAFENWYNAANNTVLDSSFVINENISIYAKYTVEEIELVETEITKFNYSISVENENDRWFLIYLSESDYADAGIQQDVISSFYDLLVEFGTLDKIIIKGEISIAGQTRTQATLAEIFNNNGKGEAIFLNIWREEFNGSIAFRLPGVSVIEEIEVLGNCMFPSYGYISGTSVVRYMVSMDRAYKAIGEQHAGENIFPAQDSAINVDIQMEKGAAVRLAGISNDSYNNSGLRFTTKILKTDVDKLNELVTDGKYLSVSFGTIIVPTDYITGGQITHDWLTKNYGGAGTGFLDIAASGFGDGEDSNYYYFRASIVKIKDNNKNRFFSAVGYIKLEISADEFVYVYTSYDVAYNSRSAAFVAEAAINDRADEKSATHMEFIAENNNWSPYSITEMDKMEEWYITRDLASDHMGTQELSELKAPRGTKTITINKKLNGPYVELVYSTNVDVWGVFTYSDGSKQVNEDFYLQAGTNSHKQYLDLFRNNAVGKDLNYGTEGNCNLTMVSITFTNAEFEDCTTVGEVTIFGMNSEWRVIDLNNQEKYVTMSANGTEITVGAHLGLGGALTYLAKAGIYEGLSGSFISRKVTLSTSTSDFSDYYGSATSSKPGDGAVNLINNYDAGRQIQQSWYAAVGGTTTGEGNGSNKYTRAFCKTESPSGKYWPYNPVQAGDVVSNPSQIIDYEVNETKGYIYVKARAMDWAKGQKDTDKLANTVVGGVTTKSYMENYYRLKVINGMLTLVVNNTFIDWNGFESMETCDWASTELPAVYPIQSLNYYVSNINGTWGDALEYNSGLGSWTQQNTALHQFATPNLNDTYDDYTMDEEWFAWANGGNGSSFGMGVYIPNVDRFTSGRSTTSNNQYSSGNNNSSSNWLKQKGLMSNMQEITKSYQGAYVGNTSYTAPGINFKMEAYKKIEYSYVICLDTVDNIRATFKNIYDNGLVTNAGSNYQKTGLDAWARADKAWTW